MALSTCARRLTSVSTCFKPAGRVLGTALPPRSGVSTHADQPALKAAAVVIGDEILKGRVQDENTIYLGRSLFEKGVSLRRVEVVTDSVHDISNTLTRLSKEYDILFTSGGIGPTHDDRTYEAVAHAYSLKLQTHDLTVSRMRASFQAREPPIEINEARMRMALLPQPSEVIAVPGIWAPIVRVGRQCFVLPGVPRLFQLMVDHIVGPSSNLLPRQSPLHHAVLYSDIFESDMAIAMADLEREFPGLIIGSYPTMDKSKGFHTMVTFDSPDSSQVDAATSKLQSIHPCRPTPFPAG